MYTRLFVTHDDAEKLFINFGRKPLEDGESGVETLATLDEHFNVYLQSYLDTLGATLEIDRREGLFVLNFDRYLAHVPPEIKVSGVSVVRAEIKRFNSAPTKARAGYYEDSTTGFSATVERTFPAQHDHYRKSVPLYAQNIVVAGPSLTDAQEFNSKLSCGFFNRFLVNAFE